MSGEKKYSGKILVRGPKSLHKSLAELADREDVTLNQLAVYLLARGIGEDAVLKAHGNQK